MKRRDSIKYYEKISVLLAFLLVFTTLTSCGQVDKNKEVATTVETSVTAEMTELAESSEDEKEAEATEAMQDKDTRTVTDMIGRTVEIPKDPQRVLLTFWPLASAYTLFQGSAETIVGMDPGMLKIAQESLLSKIDPAINDVNTSFMNEEGGFNEEELIKLNPDLALIPGYATKQLEVLEKLNIPAIVFDVTVADFNTVETYMAWIDVFGQAFDKQSKSTQIREYGDKIMNLIADRTKDLKEEDKPKALLLIQYNDKMKSTSGKNQFARFELETSGANHVAKDNEETFIQLDMEQIYEWDPEVIYISSFSDMTPENLYTNTAAEGDDWSPVTAVKNKNVHKFPIGMFHWYPPSSDSPLALLWLAKNNHPDLFSDIDMRKETKEYFKDLYDVDLTEENLDQIFNQSR